MPQIKKPAVRDRILKSADRLFEKKSYVGTTLAAIAKDSKTSIGSIYIYFSSKIEIFYTLYTPWFRTQIENLEKSAAKISSPEERLRHILHVFWYEIPTARKGFSNNLIQAISGAEPGQRSFDLLWWASDRLMNLIRACLPAERHGILSGRVLADILFMAYGGYSINYKFGFPHERIAEAVDLMTALLLGKPVAARKLDPMFGYRIDGPADK